MALLEDRTAVVTGGSSGIGRGIALAFAQHGADAVIIADIQENPKEGGTPTHDKIQEDTSTSSTFVNCDVRNQEDIESAVAKAEEFNGLNVMVNNAGIWHPENFLEVDEDQYQRMMDINLKGAYFGSQAAAKRMADDDGGCIINISSIAGLFGNGNWPTYAASKGGLTMLTYSLAHGLAEYGIRVNAIHPGGIETMIAGDQETSPDQSRAFLESVPLGRYGQPEEIGGASVFLASELASYVTGESLVVDGGWTSWR